MRGGLCRYNLGYLHVGTCGELMASGLGRYMGKLMKCMCCEGIFEI